MIEETGTVLWRDEEANLWRATSFCNTQTGEVWTEQESVAEGDE